MGSPVRMTTHASVRKAGHLSWRVDLQATVNGVVGYAHTTFSTWPQALAYAIRWTRP